MKPKAVKKPVAAKKAKGKPAITIDAGFAEEIADLIRMGEDMHQCLITPVGVEGELRYGLGWLPDWMQMPDQWIHREEYMENTQYRLNVLNELYEVLPPEPDDFPADYKRRLAICVFFGATAKTRGDDDNGEEVRKTARLRERYARRDPKASRVSGARGRLESLWPKHETATTEDTAD